MSFTVFRGSDRDGYRKVGHEMHSSDDDERHEELIGLVRAESRGSEDQVRVIDSAGFSRDDVSHLHRAKVTQSRDTEIEQKTVEQVIDSIGFGWFQLRLVSLVGVAIISDSMEILTLTILAPALHCDMHLRAFDQALLTSVVFGGMMLGASVFGGFCDKYGRKACLVLYPVITGYFGLLCAFAPRFEWILILRCLVGFGVGGSAQVNTYLSEFLPTKWRAKGLVVISVFWALGSVFESLLALVVMPSYGWRYLLAFSSLPILSFTLVAINLPESPRYLLLRGREEEARRVLEHIAKINKASCTIPHLVTTANNSSAGAGAASSSSVNADPNYAIGNSDEDDDEILLNGASQDGDQNDGSRKTSDKASGSHDLGRIRDMFSPSLRRTTITLWPIWLNTAFAYYGIVLLTTEIFEMNGTCGAEGGGSGDVKGSSEKNVYSDECYVQCRMLSTSDYLSIMLTSLAEFASIGVSLVVIDCIGRKLTLALTFLVYGVSTLLLYVCMGRLAVTFVLFVARAFISSAFQAIYVYTPEVYPTSVRAVGLGICSGMARLGAIVTPMIAQILSKVSLSTTIGLYGASGLISFALSLSLPIETRGRVTLDTVH